MDKTVINFDFDKMLFKKINKAWGLSRATKELLFIVDQIKNGKIETSGEVTYVEGVQGAKLGSLNKSKDTKISWTNGYVNMSVLAQQYGSEIEHASESRTVEVPEIEFVTVEGDATTITFAEGRTPVADSLKFIYKAQGDMTKGTGYSVGAEASATTFAVSGNTITLPTGVFEKGDTVIVPYDFETTTGIRLDDKADAFSDDIYLVVQFLAEDPCTGLSYLVNHVTPKATVTNSVALEVGENGAEHAFEATGMVNPCSIDKTTSYLVLAN